MDLPDYEGAAVRLPMYLIGSCIFWLLVFPLFFARSDSSHDDDDNITNKDQTKDASISKKTRSEETPKMIPFWTTPLAVVGLVVTSILLVLYGSPYNAWLARRIFVAPLFTTDECQNILLRAHAAAQRNAQQAHLELELAKNSTDHPSSTSTTTSTNETTPADTWESLLRPPVGWSKLRHKSYPTTDLNLVTDGFTSEDRAYVASLLDQRLAPLLSRLFGIPMRSIRSYDMFVVRYDAAATTDDDNDTAPQIQLPQHTDSGHMSFIVNLNHDFENGGTRFWNRRTRQPFAHVQPNHQDGTVLMQPAILNHEGFPISQGTRYILVGFTFVDNIHPISQESHGLSWWASWCNGNWLPARLKQSIQASEERAKRRENEAEERLVDQYWVQSLFRDVFDALVQTLDAVAPHRMETLVLPDNRQAFLEALSSAPIPTDERDRATWFQGQQLYLNLDGSIEGAWSTRTQKANNFVEDEL